MCNPIENLDEIGALEYLYKKGESTFYLRTLNIYELENLVNYYRREEFKIPIKVIKNHILENFKNNLMRRCNVRI